MDDLKRRMEHLGDRGEPRGAARVLTAARLESAVVHGRPHATLITAIAIAACVLLVAGIAAAVVSPADDDAQQVAGPTTTEPTTTTTQPATTTTTAAAAPTTAPPPTVPPGVVAASRLQPFKSWGAYLSYVKTKGVEVVGPYGLPALERGSVAFVPPQRGPNGELIFTATLGARDEPYSDTNNQEPGIDEPDTAKSDGRTIFVIESGVLRTYAGSGALRPLGSISVPATSQLLLVGNRVVLLGSHYDNDKQQSYAVIAVVDVRQPAAPRLASRFEVEGDVVSARLIGGAPRIVLRSAHPQLGVESRPLWSETEAQASTERHRARIQTSGVADWVPNWVMREGPKKGRTGQLVRYDHIYRPPTFSGFGLLTTMTLDLDDLSASDASSVVADGQVVYASPKRLYVATNGWAPLASDLAAVPASSSLIHAFDVTAPDRSPYRVSGKVDGIIRDQFSMSEYEGVLRVATSSSVDPAGGSSVRTLADQGQILSEIGSLGGLGTNEQLFAVRFIGPLGYLVTYRIVDPLHVIDVADPRHPRLRGELSIPGYSSYLHPLGDGLLLGLGAETTEEGRRAGFQSSVFDVADPTAPKRLQHFVVPGAYSPTEFNHHAFLYWPSTRLAVVPLSRPPVEGDPGFQGAVGLRVGRDRLQEVGRIQHPEQPPKDGQPAMRPSITRALVIGNRLYTVSGAGILQSDLATLADGTWVPFG